MKRKYPTEIEHTEWMRRQNYFLEEQNKTLKKKLLEILKNKLQIFLILVNFY